MSNAHATEEEIRKAIVPKSDQLNADDLVAGPITVTITAVRKGDKEQPIIVDIEGHRPYKPCKTMLRVLVEAYTKEAKDWVGKRMTLYRDPDVLWAGVRVGGIRISHLSGLKEPKTFVVTLSRTRKAEIVIYPVVDSSPDNKAAIDKYTADIAAANSTEELKAVGFLLKNQPKAVQDAVRGTYANRQKVLSKPPEPAPNGNGRITANLQEWKTGIELMTTAESCDEFRRDALPDCPEEYKAAVEVYLANHEETLRNSLETHKGQ